ncbi:aspartate aminotransferase family protein [Desulfobacterota bacterium AH_259_B03_O07]|nr:aspartate aminotransferase family protein [Desulfobacterota bacterium AH_259_B03_O07]
MTTYGRYPITFIRGKGSWLWDNDGNRYLDFTSGIAVTNLGHSHPAIIKALREQSKKLATVCNLFHIEEQADLAELLIKNSFADKVFFCNSGAEANEGAIKLARKWGGANGGRYKIISAKGSFHGRTLGALSSTGQREYQKGFRPLLKGFKFVPYGETDPIRRAIRDEKTCAVILEPIQGENGVIVPPDDYLKKVRELCTNNNILLILDEIQVGLGRTGRLYAYEHSAIVPDIMTLAKALGGGIPCGAVLANDGVSISFTPGSHGSTLGGNPLAMRTGSAVLKAILDNGLLDNSSKLGDYFNNRLKYIENKFSSLINEARGKGLILGLEFRRKEIAKEAVNKCIAKGLLTILTVEKVMRILPPLTVNKYEIDFAINKLEETLEEVQYA